jgi:chaperonin GroES
MSKLKPLNGYLVIKPAETEEETYGNIVIPDLGKERPEIGVVVEVSSTYNYHTDVIVKSKIKVGQKVLIPKLGAARITVEGEEYFLCKEQDLYAIFDDTNTEDGLKQAFEETAEEAKKWLSEGHYFTAGFDKINEPNQEIKP